MAIAELVGVRPEVITNGHQKAEALTPVFVAPVEVKPRTPEELLLSQRETDFTSPTVRTHILRTSLILASQTLTIDQNTVDDEQPRYLPFTHPSGMTFPHLFESEDAISEVFHGDIAWLVINPSFLSHFFTEDTEEHAQELQERWDNKAYDNTTSFYEFLDFTNQRRIAEKEGEYIDIHPAVVKRINQRRSFDQIHQWD